MPITMYAFAARGGWTRLADDRIQTLFQAFQRSRWIGQEPDRFGFVHVQLMNPDTIFGFFAQQYSRLKVDYDDQKREETSIEDDFEHYLFVYQPNLHRVLLQRRKSYEPDLPPWSTIFARFADLLRLVVYQAELLPPPAVNPIIEGYTREQFIDYFNNPQTRITYLNVENLDADLLPSNFPFFNPNREFNEAYAVGSRRTAINTKRVVMQATEDGDLSQTPDAKGYIHEARDPKVMRLIVRETKTEAVLEASRESKVEVEVSIEGAVNIPVDDITKIVNALNRRQQRPERQINLPRRHQEQLAMFEGVGEEAGKEDAH